MEDKIRREMEDTKETIQKSNKLLSSGRLVDKDVSMFRSEVCTDNVSLLQPSVS